MYRYRYTLCELHVHVSIFAMMQVAWETIYFLLRHSEDGSIDGERLDLLDGSD